MVEYNEDYYERKIKKYGYSKKIILKNVESQDTNRLWIACSNVNNNLNLDKTLITLGIGINNVPHIGTISQILKAIFLQKKGYFVQIVLGDLDVVGARNISISQIELIIEEYKKFITALGFDINKGILRTQSEEKEVLLTAYFSSQYLNETDFLEIEEDINNIYNEKQIINQFSFGLKNSYNLMFADFITPCLNNMDKVIFLSGIDEAQYGWKANQIIKRMGLNKEIGTLSSKLIRGINNTPKMSKSLKNSSINVLTPKNDIENIFSKMIEKNVNDIIEIINCLTCFDTAYIEYLKNIKDKKKIEKEIYQCIDRICEVLGHWDKEKRIIKSL